MPGLWDSIFHVLKDNGTDIAGKGFGTVGDVLGFASTLTEGKTSENLTIASGAMAGASGVSGMIGSGGAIRKSSAIMKAELDRANTEREEGNENAAQEAEERAAVAKEDKVNGWLDATENFLNAGTGVADITTGILGRRAIDNPEKQEEFTRKKGIAQIVSGGAAGLSGLFSLGRGIADLARYRKKGKLAGKDAENAAKKRKEAAFKLAAGGLKIFNAAGTMGQGIFMHQSPGESLDSDNSTTKFWSIWRGVSSGAATVPGLADSFFTGKKVVNEVDSRIHIRIRGARQRDMQEENPQQEGELSELRSQQEEESQESDPFVISE